MHLKTCEVTCKDSEGNNYRGDIIIPSSVEYKNNTVSVIGIGNSAFVVCSSLTSIEIPNSVTSIGISAFEGCSCLTSIEIPNSVTSIGNSAFKGCSSLTSIKLSNNLTTLPYGLFYGCENLSSLTIPGKIESIEFTESYRFGPETFYNCYKLKTLRLEYYSTYALQPKYGSRPEDRSLQWRDDQVSDFTNRIENLFIDRKLFMNNDHVDLDSLKDLILT